MKKREIPALRAKLTEYVEAKIADGWEIVPGWTYDRGKRQCCPMGAVTDDRWVTGAGEILGLDFQEIISFIHGFDRKRPENNHMYRLGIEFRERYAP